MKLEVHVNHKAHRRFAILLMIFIFALFLNMNLIVPIIILKNDVVGIVNSVLTPSFAYMFLFMCVFVLQFVLASLSVSERFKILNDYLR